MAFDNDVTWTLKSVAQTIDSHECLREVASAVFQVFLLNSQSIKSILQSSMTHAQSMSLFTVCCIVETTKKQK